MIRSYKHGRRHKSNKEYNRVRITSNCARVNCSPLIPIGVWLGLGWGYLEAVDVEMVANVTAHSGDVNEQVDDVEELKN